MSAEPSPVPFRVLTVCTGNICRSPAVERLLRARLGAGVEVTSAGTRARAGDPVSGPMVPLMESAGASADGFVARQLTEAMVREADLVLVLTRAHRSAVVELHPAAVRRTFTLRELARLAADVDRTALPAGSPAERLAALLPLAVTRRGVRSAQPTDDDVVDPYRLADGVYRASFAQLAAAVDVLVDVLTDGGADAGTDPRPDPAPDRDRRAR